MIKRIDLLILLAYCCLYGYAQEERINAIRSNLFQSSSGKVTIVAHRGDWRNTCENSIEAIESAIRMGVDVVEIDISQTKDGTLILMHDKELNRTTTGKGKVSDYTLSEIKSLYLRNGCHIKTPYKVPTLEEALLTAKGRVMLNLDKAYTYWEQIYKLLVKTKTTNLIIMKSSLPATEIKNKYGRYIKEIIFVPKVDLDDKDCMLKLNEYLNMLNPVAVAFRFTNDKNPHLKEVKQTMKGKGRIWYNTLWSNLVGGHDDNLSFFNPQEGYGYLVDSLGASIIMTDRPGDLIRYLSEK